MESTVYAVAFKGVLRRMKELKRPSASTHNRPTLPEHSWRRAKHTRDSSVGKGTAARVYAFRLVSEQRRVRAIVEFMGLADRRRVSMNGKHASAV